MKSDHGLLPSEKNLTHCKPTELVDARSVSDSWWTCY